VASAQPRSAIATLRTPWLGRAAVMVLALGAGAAHTASFYPISGISSNVDNYFPVANLIEGPGVV